MYIWTFKFVSHHIFLYGCESFILKPSLFFKMTFFLINDACFVKFKTYPAIQPISSILFFFKVGQAMQTLPNCA